MQHFQELEGVKNSTFDLRKAEVTAFVTENGPKPEQLLKECLDQGQKCVIGAGHGSYQKAKDFPDGCDVVWLTKTGQVVDIEKNLVPGKVTVFDFYANWCGPCRRIDNAMVKLLPDMPYVAYRKINIVHWDSPVALQQLANISQLPYLVVYDKKGKKLGEINGVKIKTLTELIKRGNTP